MWPYKEQKNGARLRKVPGFVFVSYFPDDIFSAYAIIRLSTLSFEFLHMLIISNNSGSSAFEMVYETGSGSSDCSVRYSTDVLSTFAMTESV